tara:strand:- start:13835 stop:14110 length:276 start_codon:yes stop_codon:yes gene_type:complete
MITQEAIDILVVQKDTGKTPIGRPLTELAVNAIDATIEDLNQGKNVNQYIVQCKGCGYINTILLTSGGCLNCGVGDMEMNVNIDTSVFREE